MLNANNAYLLDDTQLIVSKYCLCSNQIDCDGAYLNLQSLQYENVSKADGASQQLKHIDNYCSSEQLQVFSNSKCDAELQRLQAEGAKNCDEYCFCEFPMASLNELAQRQQEWNRVLN